MNTIKMVCLDIDGTLLNSKHELTFATKEAIQIASREMGIPIVLVSARMPQGMLFLQRELQIEAPMICYSGALIWENGKIIEEMAMPVTQAKQAATLAESMGLHVSLYRRDRWFIQTLDQWAAQESAITRIIPESRDFAALWSAWGGQGTGPNKIMCMAEPDKIQHFLGEKDNHGFFDCLNVYPSKPTYLELMPKTATKIAAIEFLCNRIGINRSEVMAVGDNFNDINMIEFAGLGIAMGNAPEQVKRYADETTLSCDEDGVAHALNKYVLQRRL